MTYTSPSGKSFSLSFDDVSRAGGKKAPVIEAPGTDGGTVQDLGNITPVYPVVCYISGSDYDIEADRFWEAMHEIGPGILNHPRWGNLRVLPNPRTQVEQFVEGAGRAVFNIDFILAPEGSDEYPKIEAAPDLQIAADAEQAASDIADSLYGTEITDPGALAGLKASVLSGLTKTKAAFATVSAAVDGLQEDIQAAITTITNEIDTLITAPADLMAELLTLYRLPARTVTGIQSKIEGYEALYTTIVSGFVSQTTAYGQMVGLVNASQVNAIQAAAAESTIDGTIRTRAEAASIISKLNDLNSGLASTLESVETAGGFYSDHVSRLSAESAAARAVSNLIDRSLGLPAEKKKTLTEDATPLNIVFTLYEDLDNFEDTLDQFIEYNALTGPEILLVPRGREVRWYE